MNVLLIDAHPDTGRYASHLLEVYRAALPASAEVTLVALRDLTFDPNLAHGYRQRTEWEPDLRHLAELLDACDHLALSFPMWWGAEPATLKGLLDRLFLPGFTFAYHDNDTWWDRNMAGRSADVIITMDTPPFFLRLAYGNSIIHRWKKQVLGFAGFKPVRILPLGQVKFGGAERKGAKWESKVRGLAQSIRQAQPDKKQPRLEAFLNCKKS
ncbi:MAG: NAD(P)H-dependent oxidoreductase [Erythrobacter sp.]|jgi:NAD(P)H dehydrogenase (quinone)|uniref:NAD(P)H-dependent oxidoreductase n=1 Tax=Erythrobacter sp. TaxID=1042 RepID=UPI002B46655F|nr:NAD(P)H-dependent oxidoreductase [Erythrobacter sp.]WRH70917.1 MAG: NAD(P)H-dependent oxidoreductase [Erythrobacter sp.]